MYPRRRWYGPRRFDWRWRRPFWRWRRAPGCWWTLPLMLAIVALSVGVFARII